MTKEEILNSEYGKLIANPDKVYLQNPSIIKAAHSAMDIYARIVAIRFIEYHDKHRSEEGRWFDRQCKKLGGVFTMASRRIEDIYRDYIAKNPIESYIIPEETTYWEYNSEGKLIHSTDAGGSQEGLKIKQK